MANIKIVLADTDEKYLMPLERKFIDSLDDMVELIVITDPNYLKEYFSTPQRLDILIINEDLFDTELERHNISNIFVLKEEEIGIDSKTLEANGIYKYTSVKEIYNEVINKSSTRMVPLNNTEETKILMMYSPVGGIGKTTISVALCEAFTKYHKKVLYIGIDKLQTFGSIIENLPLMESGVEKIMLEKSEYIYDMLKTRIVSRSYDILPPFYYSLPSLNLKGEEYFHLLHCIKGTKTYDFIIVDGTSDFTEDTSKLMGYANHTIIVAGQDKISGHKLDCLLRNIDCSDNERFIFICNKFRNEKENILSNEYFSNLCRISEYIDYMPDTIDSELSQLDNRNIQKLALMFI